MTTLTNAQRLARHADGGCDCADPNCGLPSGRCYLCGTPIESDPERTTFSLCDEHYKAAMRLERDELRAAKAKRRVLVRVVDAKGTLSENAGHEENLIGWGVFNDGEIERDDQADLFAGDDEAAAYVAERLGITPAYPDGA